LSPRFYRGFRRFLIFLALCVSDAILVLACLGARQMFAPGALAFPAIVPWSLLVGGIAGFALAFYEIGTIAGAVLSCSSLVSIIASYNAGNFISITMGQAATRTNLKVICTAVLIILTSVYFAETLKVALTMRRKKVSLLLFARKEIPETIQPKSTLRTTVLILVMFIGIGESIRRMRAAK
jgi:hypothetical protein